MTTYYTQKCHFRASVKLEKLDENALARGDSKNKSFAFDSNVMNKHFKVMTHSDDSILRSG